MQKMFFSKASLPTLPMTSTWPSHDAGKATLVGRSKWLSHLPFGTGPLTLAILRCIQQVTRTSTEEVAINKSHTTNSEDSRSKDFILSCQVSDWLSARFGYVNVGPQWPFTTTCGSFHEKKKHRSQQWLLTVYLLQILGSHAAKLHSSWFGSFTTNSYMR